MIIILKIIWLFLPLAFANMAPVIFSKVEFLNVSIDEKLFGENKTYRGFFFGIITGTIIAVIQQTLYLHTKTISTIDYSQINIYVFGITVSFFALLGDLIKSFIKRKLNIHPGKPFIPFDQIDWIIFGSIGIIIFQKVSLAFLLYSIVLLFLLHILVNIISYKLKIRKTII